MINRRAVAKREDEFRPLFLRLAKINKQIKGKLTNFANGKKLKGNEHVGWLGEIYGKFLLGGTLVGDREEHDVETPKGDRISVKARKGNGSGWRQSSAIPKKEGDQCPTHLLFVHLNDDYSIDRMWLYNWADLKKQGRFKRHIVRGRQRSYIFHVDERNDKPFIVYP